MNLSKIEWCDHTWNPLTGCNHGCEYCYARRMAGRFSLDVRMNKASEDQYRIEDGVYILDDIFVSNHGQSVVYPFGFEPTYHRYRLSMLDKLKVGNRIFVGAMTDIFGRWVKDEWLTEIFSVCQSHPQHVYMFLTKNPERYWELEDKGVLPVADNNWYGYSYTRSGNSSWGSKFSNKHSFVSVEPLLEDLSTGLFSINCMCPAAEWVIIGAETGRRKDKVVPEKEWIDKILLHCDKFQIPVFMKDSLKDIVGEENMRREYPAAMETYLQDNHITSKQKERLFGNCAKCGINERKNRMIALSAREKRGVQAKQIGFLCKACYTNFCKELNMNPDFER
ncbi:MAG: DUF5131 family protein [Lachnospiraceae bacterium]